MKKYQLKLKENVFFFSFLVASKMEWLNACSRKIDYFSKQIKRLLNSNLVGQFANDNRFPSEIHNFATSIDIKSITVMYFNLFSYLCRKTILNT